MRKLVVFAAGLVAALALTVPGAIGGPGQTPGVTAKSITIGGTFPLTGPAASYAPIPLGMKAYFSYVNARRGPDGKRGVMGRQIVCKYYDDGVQPRQHGSAHASARRAGQGLRDGRPARHGAGPRGTRLHEPAEGAADARLDRGVVLGHRSTRSSRGRSAGSPTTSPRVASTVCTSRRTPTARRSRSSTRTTTTARTTCTGSAAGARQEVRRRQHRRARRRTRRRRRASRRRWCGSRRAVRRSSSSSRLPTPTITGVSRRARRSATTPSRSTSTRSRRPAF